MLLVTAAGSSSGSNSRQQQCRGSDTAGALVAPLAEERPTNFAARQSRSYAAEEEEAQETSLPLDFGDSLPPRLTPLADKQFR
jgi:hypothetical protein